MLVLIFDTWKYTEWEITSRPVRSCRIAYHEQPNWDMGFERVQSLQSSVVSMTFWQAAAPVHLLIAIKFVKTLLMRLHLRRWKFNCDIWRDDCGKRLYFRWIPFPDHLLWLGFDISILTTHPVTWSWRLYCMALISFSQNLIIRCNKEFVNLIMQSRLDSFHYLSNISRVLSLDTSRLIACCIPLH